MPGRAGGLNSRRHHINSFDVLGCIGVWNFIYTECAVIKRKNLKTSQLVSTESYNVSLQYCTLGSNTVIWIFYEFFIMSYDNVYANALEKLV